METVDQMIKFNSYFELQYNLLYDVNANDILYFFIYKYYILNSLHIKFMHVLIWSRF